MPRLIYLKVFLKAQSLDAWILFVSRSRNPYFSLSCGGSFILSGIRKMLSGLWLHKFAVTASHVSNRALLSVSATSLLPCTLIHRLCYLVICLTLLLRTVISQYNKLVPKHEIWIFCFYKKELCFYFSP